MMSSRLPARRSAPIWSSPRAMRRSLSSRQTRLNNDGSTSNPSAESPAPAMPNAQCQHDPVVLAVEQVMFDEIGVGLDRLLERLRRPVFGKLGKLAEKALAGGAAVVAGQSLGEDLLELVED